MGDCLEIACGVCLGLMCLKAVTSQSHPPQQQQMAQQYAAQGPAGFQAQPYPAGYPPKPQAIYVVSAQGPPAGYPGSGGPPAGYYPGQAKPEHHHHPVQQVPGPAANTTAAAAPPVGTGLATGYPISGYPGSSAAPPFVPAAAAPASTYAGIFAPGGEGAEGKPTGTKPSDPDSVTVF